MFLKYFKWTLIFAVIVYGALFYATGSWQYLYSAMILSVVEIAVSFDNAVVNASKLHRMSLFWKKMFLTVGLLIAVGVMRFYLPLEIVAIVGKISLSDAYGLALNDHEEFARILVTAKDSVNGFGGAFLMMVALKYFIDGDKDVHWIPFLEKPFAYLHKLSEMGKLEAIHAMITLGVAFALYTHGWSLDFFLAAVIGVLIFILIDTIKAFFELFDEKMESGEAKGISKWLAGGLGTFLYLEVLDASFSFDGVIAAFAISTNVFVVAAGLAVGALCVRSMTIMLDETGTIGKFRYLENGAYLAILALSIFMFAGPKAHAPEWIIAGTSLLLIAGSWLHSHVLNVREAKQAHA